MKHEHILGGCAPTPLAHYLKALAILRLIAEQKDPDAGGRWQGEQFVLRTVLNGEELERFFLAEYCPTPIIAPWNGGSGFYPKDNKNAIDSIATATTERLAIYRDVIDLARNLVGERQESPKNDEKTKFLYQARAILPDVTMAWFDAAVLLTAEKPDYPPLLGTGGNDGRLDFTNNFMQRLIDIFHPADGKPTARAALWLRGALKGEAAFGLVAKAAIGQFSPGHAGGPNATAGFDSASLINPWDFILMLEGTLLFAGSTSRRLASSESAALSCPFTVRTTGSGAGGGNVADEAQSRAEIWLPLWRKSITLQESRALFAEGRVTVGRRVARDGLDFARAVSGLGVDRGIAAFQRYGFLMRSGKAYLATPLTRVEVVRAPQADLLTQLDRQGWLDRLRRFARDKNSPGRFQQLVRRLEDEIFTLTRGGGRVALQNVLILLGKIHLVCAESAKLREAVAPLQPLASEWVLQADDGSAEFRLACALAGLTGMRAAILPLSKNEKTKRSEWLPGGPKASWGNGSLVANLLRALERRMLDAGRAQGEADPFTGHPPADLAAILAFLRGETDDQRLAALLTGLVIVDLPRRLPGRDLAGEHPPVAFSLLKPLFTPNKILQLAGLVPETSTLPLPRQIVTLLRSNNRDQAQRALALAWRRLRIAGFKMPANPLQPPDLVNLEAPRLAATLMIPLAVSDLVRICKTFMPDQQKS